MEKNPTTTEKDAAEPVASFFYIQLIRID
jgi:hypothetical protein